MGITASAGHAAGVWPCATGNDRIWHWDYNSGLNRFDASNNEYFRLMNNNGQCLGVAGGSTTQGSQVVGATCVNHNDQFWFWDGGLFANTAHFVDYGANKQVLAVKGGLVQRAQSLVIFANLGSSHPDQLWF